MKALGRSTSRDRARLRLAGPRSLRSRGRRCAPRACGACGVGTQDGREQRTREVVSELCGRDEPKSVDRTDHRKKLTQEELAEVNRQAMRISDEVQGGWSRAVVAKQLAEKVALSQTWQVSDTELLAVEAILTYVGVLGQTGRFWTTLLMMGDGVITTEWNPCLFAAGVQTMC